MVSAYETPQDFPGGPVVSRKTPNAEDMGSIPSQVRSHMPGQLSPFATSTEICKP